MSALGDRDRLRTIAWRHLARRRTAGTGGPTLAERFAAHVAATWPDRAVAWLPAARLHLVARALAVGVQLLALPLFLLALALLPAWGFLLALRAGRAKDAA